MEIKLTESEAAKITRSRSIRISLLEEQILANRGMTPGEALRKGLDMVLCGVDAPAVTRENVRDWQSNPIWEKHVGYFIYADTLEELCTAWSHFVAELDEENYDLDPRMQAYCDPLYKKLGGTEETF